MGTGREQSASEHITCSKLYYQYNSRLVGDVSVEEADQYGLRSLTQP
jgi:hypothetical protein